MMTVPFKFVASCLNRSNDANVSARLVLKAGTPFVRRMWADLFGLGAHVAPHECPHGGADRLVLVHDCVYFATDRHLNL
jgi:hypothetical protein